MKLNLAIIHLDMVIDTIELEPGQYRLGRSSQNNIAIPHFSLEAFQGLVFCEDGKWFYQEETDTKPREINNERLIKVTNQISLATGQYVEESDKKLHSFGEVRSQHKQKINKRVMISSLASLGLLLAVIVSYQVFRGGFGQATQTKLIERVRDKIVEFESNRDDVALGQLKQYAGLQDSDLKQAAGFCTGFLVGPNIVLTAAHCLFGRLVIDLNNDFYLKTSDGKQHQIKEILGFDVKRDFLFLRTEGMESYGHLNFSDDYGVEQKVYTVGNVHGEGIAIRDGILSSETSDPDEPDVKFLRYSAGTSPGNSGGPLLDKNGDVVALVFASTMTENFNLGTPARYLKQAFQKYVIDQNDQPLTVEIAMKRVLNFKPSLMLQSLSLPYLPQFDEYPEISEKFREVAISVELPIAFEQVGDLVLRPLNEKVVGVFNEVQEILRQKQEIVLDWKSFVSDQTPAILPSQFDISQSVFVKEQGKYFPLISGLIDSPSKADFKKYKDQLEKENKFDFQAYGYNLEFSEKKFDLLNSDIFYKPKNVSGNKIRLQTLAYGAPYSQLLVFSDEDIRTKGFYGLKQFMKNFIGENGVIANSGSRFVRPLAIKEFTIESFDFDSANITRENVKDRIGRTWERSHIKLFEGLNLYTYCIDLPASRLCVGRSLNLLNDVLLEVIESNFRNFILSHLIINPYFWDINAYVNFLSEGSGQAIPSMNGVGLKKSKDAIKVSLPGFKVEFDIKTPQSVESMRLQTGLYGNDSQVDWSGYGVEWVRRTKKQDYVCGAGVEAFKSQSTFILNFLRDRRKQEKMRKIKGESAKPLPGVWYKPFRGLERPFQLYGYCAPLQEDPRVAGQYFVDFKHAKPYKFPYTLK